MPADKLRENLSELLGSLKRPIVDPFVGGAKQVFKAMAESPREAVLLLDPPDTCSVDALIAGATASGRPFILRHDNTVEMRKSLTDLGLTLFSLHGDTEAVYATYEVVNNHPLIGPPPSSPKETKVSTPCPLRKSVAMQKAHVVRRGEDEENEQQLVTGVVMVPNEVDGHGEFYGPEEVERNAVDYMLWYRNFGLEHTVDITDDVTIVESWIVREDNFTHAGVPVPKGSWMITFKVWSPRMWDSFKSGVLTGLSIGGLADESTSPELVPAA